MEKDKASRLRLGRTKDEQRAPDASRTGALGLKDRMSMRSGSLRSGEWMMDDGTVSKIRVENDAGVGQTTRGHQQESLPGTFLALPRATNALAMSSFGRSGVLK